MIRPQTCPICHQELSIDAGSTLETFPFCSTRCRQVDLLRWCEGKYAIVDPLLPQTLEEHLLDQLEGDELPDDLGGSFAED